MNLEDLRNLGVLGRLCNAPVVHWGERMLLFDKAPVTIRQIRDYMDDPTCSIQFSRDLLAVCCLPPRLLRDAPLPPPPYGAHGHGADADFRIDPPAASTVRFSDFAGHKVFIEEKYLKSVGNGYLLGSSRHNILKGAVRSPRPLTRRMSCWQRFRAELAPVRHRRNRVDLRRE